MLRRAASGHIPATQLPKFAAASRIALAVIRGWPEAPSSPLQGNAALLPLAAGAPGRAVAGWFAVVEPVKMLLRKFSGPPPLEDCACASPAQSKAPASSAVAVRSFFENPVGLVMSCPCRISRPPPFRRPCHGFHQLNKAGLLVAKFFVLRPDGAGNHRSAFVRRAKTGYQFGFEHFPPPARTRPDIPP